VETRKAEESSYLALVVAVKEPVGCLCQVVLQRHFHRRGSDSVGQASGLLLRGAHFVAAEVEARVEQVPRHFYLLSTQPLLSPPRPPPPWEELKGQ